ncbi:MAG TPA: transketolase [Pirellulales bacterium]|nr:transketolase [Pirellulales bacterium]
MATTTTSIEQLSINTIRTLAMDAVQAANSGHPGTPMALAPVAYALWNRILRYDPEHPLWPGRDRYILSCGHASMLLYATLHLAGVKRVDDHGQPTKELAVPLDQIKLFRQLHSLCPGHPEHGWTTGVETTTGPLGQGIANSVGFAVAQRWLAGHFNKPGFDLFDYHIFVQCSDGDLMEGISSEAASIAGHLKLSNLCWIYDDNQITIEGHTSLAFSEDVGRRFEGYGWTVLHLADANDLDALTAALEKAKANTDTPTLIIVRSHIGYGAPHKQDTHSAHGSPLGEDEIRLTKEFYGWPADAKFLVPDEVRADFAAQVGKRGKELFADWQRRFDEYAKKYPELAAEWRQMEARELPAGWEQGLPTFPADAKGLATRVSGGKVLNGLAAKIPWLMGGAADLAPSTMTLLEFDGAGVFSENSTGRNMHFGIREHGMASAANGMALSNLRPYVSTFLVFSDYLRPTLRLAAIMGLPVIHVYTHDSIGVGEDGPTHQPVEHYAALRAIPRLLVFRPGDANEVSETYRAVLKETQRPSLLCLTRQNLPTLDRTKYAPASGVARGGYILADAPGGKPDVLLLATGSELSLAVAAHEKLSAGGVKSRVVSLPCFELFDEQPQEYRDSVLPPSVTARVAVEAGVEFGWERYLGFAGRFVGMHGFGASAPAGQLFKEFGITADHVVAEAQALLGRK